MTRPRILVIGSMNRDLIVRLARFPIANETLMGQSLSYAAGGKGGNQAVAAARSGAWTAMAGAIGTDEHGDALLAGLEEAGIETAHVARRTDVPSGLAVIYVDDIGHNQIVVLPGANLSVTEQEVERAIEATKPDAILLQLEIAVTAIQASIALARERDILTVLDAGPGIEASLTDFAGLDVVSPNESETKHWTGIDPVDRASMEAATAALREQTGAPIVLLKLGARGAYLDDGQFRDVIPAFPGIEVIDSTAAGDCFTAAAVVRYLETRDWARAVRFAHVAAALCIMKPGAQPSLPQREAIDALAATGDGGPY